MTDSGAAELCLKIGDDKGNSGEKDDFAIEIEKLQATLQEMLDCTSSPSTSLDSANEQKASSGLSARRLVRIACDSTNNPHQNFSTTSSCHSDSGNSTTCRGDPLPFSVYGGASLGRLILIDIVRREDLIGLVNPNDILLSVENVKVSGMIKSEVVKLLEDSMRDKDQIAIEVLPASSITDDITELLADRKSSGEFQTIIRENLYQKTVPYTTRPPREGEIDGEHYRFVSVEEFNRFLEQGELLENGTYQGHLYGTPRPVDCYAEQEMVMCSEGLLPPNWETAYTENGDKYFIDHNTGTTTWDDPRELPSGWEQVDDPMYGTFYVDHINKKTQYERPCGSGQNGFGAGLFDGPNHQQHQKYGTLPPAMGQSLNNGIYSQYNTGTLKSSSSPRDSGFDSSPTRYRKFQDGPLSSDTAVTSSDYAFNRSGNPLFTTDPAKLHGEMIATKIVKGPKGLGFTLIGNDASSKGDEFIQVKSVLAGGPAAANGVLRTGDILVRVNGKVLLGATQKEACDVFVSIPIGDPVEIQVCRGYELFIDPTNRIITENVYSSAYRNREKDLHEIDIFKGAEGFGFTIADSVNGQRVKKILYPQQCPNLMEGDTIVELDGKNVRPIAHTQLVDMLRERPVGYQGRLVVKRGNSGISPKSRSRNVSVSGNGNGRQSSMPPDEFSNRNTLQRQPAVVSTDYFDGRGIRPSSTTLGFATPNYIPISEFVNSQRSDLITVSLIRKPVGFGFRLLGGAESKTPLSVGQIVAGGAAEEDGRLQKADEIVEIDGKNVEGASHSDAVILLENAAQMKHVKLLVRRRNHQNMNEIRRGSLSSGIDSESFDVVLHRSENDGFGFVLMSSHNRNGSTIGQIQNGSPAAKSGKLQIGDRVIAVNSIDILNLSHPDIIALIKDSGLTVRLTIAHREAGGPVLPIVSSTLGRNFTMNGDHGLPPPPPSVLRNNLATYVPFDQMSLAETRVPINGNLIDVELERGVKGFGFSIRGGQEFGSMPLFVLRIADDGPAKGDGRLQVGDQLLTINGHSTKGMTHDEAIQIIKQNSIVKLTCLRNRLP
ncbi:unnamed protein product [Caenorhabditis angaria]|uniref:Guanylate kinase n=1 Tax=Caenorhabditis angaria TaxID=860376 RepID=A0A9P1IN46_9PELO|nr:unnamed protein product [Caenorhabditis angaria]